MTCKLILDVGKTHVKLHLLDNTGTSVFSRETPNRVLDSAPYPHFDVEGLWQWMLAGIKEAAREHQISAVSITTHGAAAALIDRHWQGEEGDGEEGGEKAGLVLPLLDYEYAGIESCNSRYRDLRPAFSETCSPDLPAGLNLGRQLFWLQQQFPEAFARATDILTYPQYWAWRLTGRRCSEVTSLGCHTDLWSPAAGDFSSLVDRLGWRDLFPPVLPGWACLGPVKSTLRELTGLSDSCRVFAGVHDSNASFLRYLSTCSDEPFTVISTGTWSILMASGTPLAGLDGGRDMLANVDVTGRPVACARFMGGREYAAVCERAGAALDEPQGEVELQRLVDAGTLALPDFSGGSGPFPGRRGGLEGAVPDGCGAALASLYCALMLDYLLDRLDARGDIFIEGAFLKNANLCALLAQLRGHQRVWLSSDDTGTVQGCAALVGWGEVIGGGVGGEIRRPAVHAAGATRLKSLESYRRLWRLALEPEAAAAVAD